jgi:prepilin-type N-terminal cleavage/methylation domain-containing protein
MSKNNNSKKGFTIIEVVLVLAIAGLIFLMVFIGYPALRTGQQDTQRKDDLARFSSQIANYSSNNRGRVPKSDGWAAFIKDYLCEGKAAGSCTSFVDPDGTEYTVSYKGAFGGAGVNPANDAKTFDHIIYVYENAKCDGEEVIKGTGNRDIAFVYKLGGAGRYCGTN